MALIVAQIAKCKKNSTPNAHEFCITLIDILKGPSYWWQSDRSHGATKWSIQIQHCCTHIVPVVADTKPQKSIHRKKKLHEDHLFCGAFMHQYSRRTLTASSKTSDTSTTDAYLQLEGVWAGEYSTTGGVHWLPTKGLGGKHAKMFETRIILR